MIKQLLDFQHTGFIFRIYGDVLSRVFSIDTPIACNIFTTPRIAFCTQKSAFKFFCYWGIWIQGTDAFLFVCVSA